MEEEDHLNMGIVSEGKIPFTQYLLPDGRKRPTWIAFPDDPDIVAKAQQILDAGYRFEIEVLSNGWVSMTITGYDPRIEEENDCAQRVCPNGPKVPSAVKDMISRFDLSLFKGKGS